MSTVLGRTETLSLLGVTIACLGVLANTFNGDGEPLIASLAFSGIAFSFAYSLIQWLGQTFIHAGLKGRDMSKPRKPEMSVVVEVNMSACLLKLTSTDRRQWELFVQSSIYWS